MEHEAIWICPACSRLMAIVSGCDCGWSGVDFLGEQADPQGALFDEMRGAISDFEHPHNLQLRFQRRLLEAVPRRGRVLELGGHRSGALRYLVGRGATGVGVDVSAWWVAQHNAWARANKAPMTWVRASAMDLPLKDQNINAVVAFDVLEHVPDIAQALHEIRRVLVPGGVLVCHQPVSDVSVSFDGLQNWWDPAGWRGRQATVGHDRDLMLSKSETAGLMRDAGLAVDRVEPFNVWLQPVHDHRWLGWLGRHRKPGPTKTHSGDPSPHPYWRVAALLDALNWPDRLGARLGIGGSAAFVAHRPR